MIDVPATLSAPPDPAGMGVLAAFVGRQTQAFPLEHVTVRSMIVSGFARTEVTQRFTNPYDVALEVLYLFPLTSSAAVTALELTFGDVTVRADLRERSEAERLYAEATQTGHSAGLLLAERQDVHALHLTRLPPGEPATVRLTIVEALEHQDGAWRFRFPTTIAPRYLTGWPVGHAGGGVLPDTDRVPDASRLQPPIRLSGGTRLDLEVEIVGPIAGVESSLHAVRVSVGPDRTRVAPSTRATMNTDFVLAVTPAATDRWAARAWTDGTYTAVEVGAPLVRPAALPRDAAFLIDISGSMTGAKLAAAKVALRTALHGLTPGDRFRLIAFDNLLELFREGAWIVYDEAALLDADRWVANLRARGGTEMLPALKAGLAGGSEPGRLHTVLFVTDGQAWNEAELVAAVANRRGAARLFTLGIDTAVNESLLRRLARVGGGACTLCTPDDDLEAIVARVEARFGAPLARQVRPSTGTAASLQPADVFAGQPALLLLEGAGPVTLVADAPEGFTVSTTPVAINVPLGALFARARIAAIEDRLVLSPFEEEALRPMILTLSLGSGVLSRFTAYVAVETSRRVPGPMVRVAQPVEAPGASREAESVLTFAAGPPAGHARDARAASRILVPRSAPTLESAAPKPAPYAPPTDPLASLAHQQAADGSFGSVQATAAALGLLVLEGHTRKRGLRSRVVEKAARWLTARADPIARAALSLLSAAEAGQAIDRAALERLATAAAGTSTGALLTARLRV